MDTSISPYEILGIPRSASVADIRAAFKRLVLCTHPDKQILRRSDGEGRRSARTQCIQSFHAVKEASELLLDPLRRAQYDHGQEQAYVRIVGAVSDVYDLDDFDLVEKRDICGTTGEEDSASRVCVYIMECRCGGVFELFLTEREAKAEGVEKLSECDSCSLIISVSGSRAGLR